MGKSKKKSFLPNVEKPVRRPFVRKTPPRMLPQSRTAWLKESKFKSILPDEYTKVSKALSVALIEKTDLKKIINHRKKFTKELYELALIAFNHTKETDYLLEKYDILGKNTFLDRWMAKVLITELLWGKQFLISSSVPVEAIKYYEEDLRESFVEVMTLFPNPENAKVATALPTYVRINTLQISVEEAIYAFTNEGGKLLPRSNTYSEHLKVLAGLEGTSFMRDYHIFELLIFPPGSSFYKHPGYSKGLFLLQDKGSCLSSFLLNPVPGSTVLDICAAPGIKTNHIANIMNNTGTIYANDIHPDRSALMGNMINLTNVRCAKTIHKDYLNIQHLDANYILVDHSSSYSGTFPKASKEKALPKMRMKQLRTSLSRALRHSLQNFPNTKRVAYTVNSIFSKECEVVVSDALAQVKGSYTLLDLKGKLGNEWLNTGKIGYACGDKCIRTIPQVDLCQGHFIAVFERNFDVPVPPYEDRTNTELKKYQTKGESSDELDQDT